MHPVNHYERLKVTQDAPPEVIRAAYRALANRLHPDPNGATAAGGDAHEQMVALNAAYEVLIDPALRRDYDDSLNTARAWLSAPEDPMPDGRAALAGASSVDLVAPVSAWAPDMRHVVMMCAGALVLITAGAVWYLKSESPSGPVDVPVNGALMRPDGSPNASLTPPAGVNRRPSVEELARMSDEELVAAMPALDEQDNPPARAAQVSQVHPLDGPGLSLKTDRELLGTYAGRSGVGRP